LAAALRGLAARSDDIHGLDVTFRAEVCPAFEPSETTASHLYRIAQEALTNAARHGRATRVDIFLAITAERFSLRIADNGRGFPPAATTSTGMGLKIMRYRADMIDAAFSVEDNEPQGTIVTVTG
jgi:two-component system, LuxR family, sensor kinase FixL